MAVSSAHLACAPDRSNAPHLLLVLPRTLGEVGTKIPVFDLTRAIVEKHKLYIDDYDMNTGDKAFREGHVYSDKAPGLALSAVPILEGR